MGKIITSHEDLRKTVELLRNNGKRIVFTNGCFDIIHPGHVMYLSEAKRMGDILVLGLNSDKSVKRLKGEKRPILNEDDRALILSHLDMVDFITVFDEDTPYNLIACVQPDILVKGGDWDIDRIVGRDIVEARGGRVVNIPFVDGKSTTGIIERIREVYNDKH